MKKTNLLFTFASILTLFASSSALARQPTADRNVAAAQEQDNQVGSSGAEHLDVNALKQKYWAKGEEGELRVVRNRTYTKSNKVELGLFWGSTSTNPFLSVRNLGATLGYHINEYFGVNLAYWRYLVSDSDAQLTLQHDQGQTADSNFPKQFVGGEVTFSPIYGKLSILGKSIIYYDMYLIGGLGETTTEAGTYITPEGGIGQQIWLTKNFSLRLDYRFTHYNENVLVKTQGADYLTVKGPNSNTSQIFSIGLTCLFGG